MQRKAELTLAAMLTLVCAGAAQNVPVTTRSPQALQYFEDGKHKAETLYSSEALESWRKAVDADPQFAQAYAFLALHETDPARARVARDKAHFLQANVPDGEALLVKWAVDASNNNMLAAVSEMNDLLAQYPDDKQLHYFVANWLMNNPAQFEMSEHVLLEALALDKDYAPALNDFAYAETYLGKAEPASKAIQRYAELLPSEPNPQDSWAEISRLNGDYQAALDHYRAALKIDPKFVNSQLGLADTYAMMGDEATARKEYAKAIAAAPSAREKMQYRLQEALTYVRAKDVAAAMRELAVIAKDAQNSGFPIEAAQAHRFTAMIAPANKKMEHFTAASRALATGEASDAERDLERANILKFTALDMATSNPKVASESVAQLKQLADRTHSDPIAKDYHVANAKMLLENGKYPEAADEALEDQLGPTAHALAAKAFESEKNPRADEEKKKVAAFHTQDIEYALATAH